MFYKVFGSFTSMIFYKTVTNEQPIQANICQKWT